MSTSTVWPNRSVLREAIASARAAFAAVDVDMASTAELGDVLEELAALRNQIDALDIAVIHKVRVTTEWAADGSRSLNAWVQRKSSCTKNLAGRKIAASKVLTCTPALAQAFRSGHTSLEHVGVVAAAIQPGHREEHVGDVDRIFTELSIQTGPGQLRKAVTAWANRLDETAIANEYADASDAAYLHVSPILSGMVRIDGLLDPETGQILIDALKATRDHLHCHRNQPASTGEQFDHANDPLLRTDQSSGNLDQLPSGADGDWLGDSRPVSQQNAAALRHLLAIALASGVVANGPSGLPVTLFVTTTIEALTAQLHTAGVIPPELVGTGPIPAAVARRLACDANIIPAVLDGQSRILDLGATKRIIPKYLRAAVTARDQHCRFGDCEHPIEEIHHVTFWSHGGKTSLDNLAGLCRAHHHAVHERGWALTGNANKQLTVSRR